MKYNRIDSTKTGTLLKKIDKIIIERIYDEDPETSYLEQVGFEDRLEQYKNDSFSFLGIRAKATILIPMGNHYLIQEITSGGLWGIESDSDESYFEEVAKEELSALSEALLQLGFNKKQINAAIKSVEV